MLPAVAASPGEKLTFNDAIGSKQFVDHRGKAALIWSWLQCQDSGVPCRDTPHRRPASPGIVEELIVTDVVSDQDPTVCSRGGKYFIIAGALLAQVSGQADGMATESQIRADVNGDVVVEIQVGQVVSGRAEQFQPRVDEILVSAIIREGSFDCRSGECIGTGNATDIATPTIFVVCDQCPDLNSSVFNLRTVEPGSTRIELDVTRDQLVIG